MKKTLDFEHAYKNDYEGQLAIMNSTDENVNAKGIDIVNFIIGKGHLMPPNYAEMHELIAILKEVGFIDPDVPVNAHALSDVKDNLVQYDYKALQYIIQNTTKDQKCDEMNIYVLWEMAKQKRKKLAITGASILAGAVIGGSILYAVKKRSASNYDEWNEDFDEDSVSDADVETSADVETA